MVRRVQLGAGIAAGILGMLSLAVLLFVPLVPYCRATTALPCASVRYDSLFHLGMDAALRTYLLGMLGLLLVGAGCAIVEAYGGRRGARLVLWTVTVLALAGSAYTAHGPGLLFLPAVLMLCLANYASLACRLVEWRHARAHARPAYCARSARLALRPNSCIPSLPRIHSGRNPAIGSAAGKLQKSRHSGLDAHVKL